MKKTNEETQQIDPLPSFQSGQTERTTTISAPRCYEGADNRRRLFITSENYPIEPKTYHQETDEDILWEEREESKTEKQMSIKHKENSYAEPSLFPGQQSLKQSSEEQHHETSEKSIILCDISEQAMNEQRMQKSFSSLLRLQDTTKKQQPLETNETKLVMESPLKKEVNFSKVDSVERQYLMNSSSITKNYIQNQTIKPKLTKGTINKFQISLLVKKFINKMVKRSTTFVFRNVPSENPFKLLSDPTYSYCDYLRQRRHNHSKKRTDDSTCKFIFDLIVFFLILFNIIYLPVKVSFEQELGSIFNSGQFEQITLKFMVIEILVNMSTQYYQRALIVKDRILVAKKYCLTRLWIDILIGVPLAISVMSTDQNYLSLFYLIRVLDFIEIFNKVEKMFQSRNQLGDSLKCILLIFFVAHLSACSIHYISTLPKRSDEESYLDLSPVDKTNWFEVYVYSFYWSIITMTTIGFGDIRPNSHRERLYATLFAVLSCVVFGFTLNQIGSIMSNIYTNSAQFRRNQAIIDRFLKKRKVTPELQVMIRKNLEYTYNDNDEESKMVKTIVSTLTSSLREQLQVELYSSIFGTSKAFGQNFSKEFTNELSLFFQEEIISQEEYLFDEREKPDKLFYVIRGEIEILIKDRKCPITVGKGELLGLEEFFSQHPYGIQAKTSRVTVIAFLRYEDFISLLAKYPIDNETYKMIYDTQNNYGRSGRLTTKCYNCANQFHQVTKCPYLFLNIDRDLALSKLIFQRQKDKMTVPDIKPDRKRQKKNAYQHQMDLWEAVYKIFDNYNEFAEYLEGKHLLEDTSDYAEADSQAELDENENEDESSEDFIEEQNESTDENNITQSPGKNDKNKKKKRKSNMNRNDRITTNASSSDQNDFFQTLKIELNKQGIDQFSGNSIDKHNPLLQRFFGGQENTCEHQQVHSKDQQQIVLPQNSNLINNLNANSPTNGDPSNNLNNGLQGQSETSLRLHKDIVEVSVQNNPKSKGSTANQESNFSKQQLSFGFQTPPLLFIPHNEQQDAFSEKALSVGKFNNNISESNNPRNYSKLKSTEKNTNTQEYDMIVPQIAVSQQINFLHSPSALSNISKNDNSNVNNTNQNSKLQMESTQLNEELLATPSQNQINPTSQVSQQSFLQQDLQHQGNVLLFLQDRNGEPVTTIKGDTNTAHLLSQSDIQFDLAIEGCNTNNLPTKNQNIQKQGISQINLFPFSMNNGNSQQKIDSSPQGKDCCKTEGSNYFKDIIRTQDINISIDAHMKQDSKQGVFDQQQQLYEGQNPRKTSNKMESNVSVKVSKESSGKTNTTINTLMQLQQQQQISGSSGNSQKLNSIPLMNLTRRISQGLTEMQQIQLMSSQQNLGYDQPIRSKNLSSIKKGSQETRAQTQIESPTRSQKQTKTFFDFCNSKLKKENDESKKLQISYLVDRPKRAAGSMKKIAFDLDSSRQRMSSVINCKTQIPREKSQSKEQEEYDELMNSQIPRLSRKNPSQRYKGLSQPEGAGNSSFYGDGNKKYANLGLGQLQLKADQTNNTPQMLLLSKLQPIMQQSNNKPKQDVASTANSETASWRAKNVSSSSLKRLTFKNNQQQQNPQEYQQQQQQQQQYNQQYPPDPQLIQSPTHRQQQSRSLTQTHRLTNTQSIIPISFPLITDPTETQLKRESKEIMNFFIIPDFDLMKVFKVYFPLNNYTRVLKNFANCKKKRNMQSLLAQDTFKQRVTIATLGNMNKQQCISRISAAVDN